MESRVRSGAAIVFVALVTGFVYAEALFDFEPGSGFLGWAATVVVVLLYFLVGLLVGRWWVLPLLLVPVALAIPLGQDSHDADRAYYWGLLLIGTIFVGSPLTLAGYLIRVLADHWPSVRRRIPLRVIGPRSS